MKAKAFSTRRSLVCLALCLVVFLALASVVMMNVGAEADATGTVASGKCGASLNWSLSADGVLTVSGSGKMSDYSKSTMPWKDYFSDIKSIVIEEGVTSIGNSAFSAEAASVAYTQVSIPSTLQSIGSYAFYKAESLGAIAIPAGVSEIGSYAFRKSGVISATFETREGWEVDGAALEVSLSDASVAADALKKDYYNCTWYCAAASTGTGAEIASGNCGTALTWSLNDKGVLTISGVGLMPAYANNSMPWYSYASEITEVVIGEGVQNVSRNAFSCEKTQFAIRKVTLPSTLIFIEPYAFYGCKSLTSVSIPASTTLICEYAFRKSGIKSVTFAETAWRIQGVNDDIDLSDATAAATALRSTYYSKLWNGTPTKEIDLLTAQKCGKGVTWSLTNTGTLTIQGTGSIDKYSAAGAPWDAYKSLISFIVINDGVTSIGNSAFYGCTSVISVTLPDSLVSIGNYSFYNCSKLEEISIPVRTNSIGKYAFRKCKALESVTFASEDPWSYNGETVVMSSALTAASKLTTDYSKAWSRILSGTSGNPYIMTGDSFDMTSKLVGTDTSYVKYTASASDTYVIKFNDGVNLHFAVNGVDYGVYMAGELSFGYYEAGKVCTIELNEGDSVVIAVDLATGYAESAILSVKVYDPTEEEEGFSFTTDQRGTYSGNTEFDEVTVIVKENTIDLVDKYDYDWDGVPDTTDTVTDIALTIDGDYYTARVDIGGLTWDFAFKFVDGGIYLTIDDGYSYQTFSKVPVFDASAVGKYEGVNDVGDELTLTINDRFNFDFSYGYDDDWDWAIDTWLTATGIIPTFDGEYYTVSVESDDFSWDISFKFLDDGSVSFSMNACDYYTLSPLFGADQRGTYVGVDDTGADLTVTVNAGTIDITYFYDYDWDWVNDTTETVTGILVEYNDGYYTAEVEIAGLTWNISFSFADGTLSFSTGGDPFELTKQTSGGDGEGEGEGEGTTDDLFAADACGTYTYTSEDNSVSYTMVIEADKATYSDGNGNTVVITELTQARDMINYVFTVGEDEYKFRVGADVNTNEHYVLLTIAGVPYELALSK